MSFPLIHIFREVNRFYVIVLSTIKFAQKLRFLQADISAHYVPKHCKKMLQWNVTILYDNSEVIIVR